MRCLATQELRVREKIQNKEHIMKSIDIVFPKNNEKEFLKIAKALGKKEIVFVYSPKEYKEWKEKEAITVKTAILAPAKEGYYLKQKYPLLVVKANQDTDKWVVEHVKPWLLYGFEESEKKDFIHHRNSGIDHILAHQMAEHGVSYGFSVGSLIHAAPEQRAIILGRMRQNVFLLKKVKVSMFLVTLTSDPMDMRNVKDVLGIISK